MANVACWERLATHNVTKEVIVKILSDGCHTDDWSLEKLQNGVWKEFYFWFAVIRTVEEEDCFSLKEHLPVALNNFGFSVSSISSFVRKIRNRITLIEKKKDFSLGYDLVFSNDDFSLGHYCSQFNVTLEWLKNPNCEGHKVVCQSLVPKGLIVELRKHRARYGFTYRDLSMWIQILLGLEYLPDIGFIRRQVDSLYQKQLTLSRNDKKEQQVFLDNDYVPPKPKVKQSVSKSKASVEKQLPQGVNNTPGNTCTIKKLENKLVEIKKEKMKCNQKFYELKKKHSVLNKKYRECYCRLSQYSARNINKRLKRRQKNIELLKAENAQLKSEKQILKMRSDTSRKNFKKVSALLRYHKTRNDVLKGKVNSHVNENSVNKEEVGSLKEIINILENENLELHEEISDLLDKMENSKMVKTFHDGKYSDDVRHVYATLLSMNVGVKNIEKVIEVVLEKLGGLKAERLPKKTFAEVMMIEAKALAQIQAAEAMLESNFNTLHTDGTKKMGKEFGGVQIGTNSGQYSIGISQLVSGNTESFTKLIDQILNDLSSLLHEHDGSNIEKKKAELLLSIKNLMTDRHIVNSCLKTCLEKLRLECIPKNDDSPDELRQKLSKLNGFKCNLHVIVNFASQAEAGLKQWEKNILNVEGEDTDASINTKFTYNQSTTDFIRACCKLCVPGADEKSGYGALFQTFLHELSTDLKLTTFHGHRINLLFAMGASVFYHKDHIHEFIDVYFEKEQRNQLVKAVAHYIQHPVYLSGCRAFGIVDKLLTGPLWRIIENTEHILDLNKVWEEFKTLLEKYSQDATELVNGKILYEQYTNTDEIFDCLFNCEDEHLNILTTEALQIILLNFQLILERQLSDCLPGGELNEDTEGVDLNLREQSKTVATTNIISERDFANLDRLQREKPNANLIALEGIILFSNNKTVEWLKNLDIEKKSQYFKIAREKAPILMKQFKERKAEIKRQHLILLQKRAEEKTRKIISKQQEIQSLTKALENIGGIWQNVGDIEKNFNKFNMTNSQKFEAVKLQLKFRKKVMNMTFEDKSLLQFSANGVSFSLNKLICNLKTVMLSTECDAYELQDNSHLFIDCNFSIKSKDEREQIMILQRDLIIKKIDEIRSKQRKSLNINEPANKKPKRSVSKNNRRNNMSHDNCHTDEISDSLSEENSDTESIPQPQVHEIKLLPIQSGQPVVVAYMENWYPGQVLSVKSDLLIEVKFLCPSKTMKNLFQWPRKDDISVVEKIFIFYNKFEINPKDSSGRAWVLTNYDEICSEYKKYCQKYFT